MKLKAIIFAATMLLPGLYAVTGAFAQDDDPIQVSPNKATPASPVAPTQQIPAEPATGNVQPAPTRFYLEVDQNDLAVLGAALNELPKKIADPVVMKLNGQLSPPAQAQITANKDSAEKAKKGKK